MALNLLTAFSTLVLICSASSAKVQPRRFSSRSLLQSCTTAGYCQNKVNGNYANPCSEEPNGIIQCSNGVTNVTTCPAGLVWDYRCACCAPPKSAVGPSSPAPAPPKSPSPVPPPTPAAPSTRGESWSSPSYIVLQSHTSTLLVYI